jgi:uncharacterized protein (TIGR03083 family)
VSPRTSRSGYPAVVAAVTGQWSRLLAAVDALGPEDWSRPTRLGWSTAELVVHLTGNVQYLLEALADQQPGKRPDTPAVTYYDDVLDDAEDISDRARMGADAGPAELRQRMHDMTDAGIRALADPPDGDTVVRSGTHLLRLEDYLITRATEGVVHGLDLPAPVQPDPAALRVAVRLLTGILGHRAAGRSVEVRVPPYAAVQLDLPDAPGPRHTRGTPPNVVEADPVSFVEVATGRVPWHDAVRDGRIRASGARADLTALLPLF